MARILKHTLKYSNRRIGGIRFIRIGNLVVSYCVTSKPFKG